MRKPMVAKHGVGMKRDPAQRQHWSAACNFLKNNKLINTKHYEFLKNKSTNLYLDMFEYNILKNLELKNFYIGIFFDLSKAFDCINFDVLFEKLHRLNFFISYR